MTGRKLTAAEQATADEVLRLLELLSPELRLRVLAGVMIDLRKPSISKVSIEVLALDASRAIELEEKLLRRHERDAADLFADCTCDGNSECEHCLELRRQQAIAAGKLQACDCGRDAQGGPYPRVHAPGCAYIKNRAP